MVPFWIRLLMSSNHHLVSFHLVHPIENGEVEREREKSVLIPNIFECAPFLCETAHFCEIIDNNLWKELERANRQERTLALLSSSGFLTDRRRLKADPAFLQ